MDIYYYIGEADGAEYSASAGAAPGGFYGGRGVVAELLAPRVCVCLSRPAALPVATGRHRPGRVACNPKSNKLACRHRGRVRSGKHRFRPKVKKIMACRPRRRVRSGKHRSQPKSKKKWRAGLVREFAVETPLATKNGKDCLGGRPPKIQLEKGPSFLYLGENDRVPPN